MTDNREWIQRSLARRDTVPVPYNFSFSPPARQRIEAHYGQSPIEEALDFPIRMTAPKSIKPLYASPAEFGNSVKDEFGVKWSTNDLDRGSPLGPCLPEPNLKRCTFPDATAAYRFEHLADWCQANQKNYRVIWVGDLWERATFMRGMENILTDLYLEPAFVNQLLRGLADYILKTMTILFERYEFDCIAVSDDYGTQNGMLMSPDSWRNVMKPLLTEIYALAHRHHRAVFHHTCGNVYPIIGDLIDIGLDILHPVQPEAMDPYQLKREFGRDLSLCGGVPTQHLLPHGTPAEVREEVKKLKHELGQGGGYILEPGITLQADVPLENMVAMIDEARGI